MNYELRIMKNIYVLSSRITLSIFIAISLISCSIKNKTNNDSLEPLISYKNDSIEYIVYELSEKVDADNQEQCNHYLNFNESLNGFEINGADMADLYSFFYRISRKNIHLNSKEINYFNIDFKGIPKDTLKREIWNKIMEIKKMGITQTTKKQDIYILDPTNSQKLNQYLSKNQSQGTEITGNNKKTIYKNATISMIVNNLNEWYSEKFVYTGNQPQKYDIEIPNGLSEAFILQYLKDQFGIKIEKSERSVISYTISEK